MTEEKKRKKRRKKHYVLRFLILVALVVAAYFAIHLPYFNVTEISISGNDDITDEEVLKLSEIKLDESIFDVHPLLDEGKIEQNMFVEKAKIQRKLPGRVVIKITERTGMAQLKFGSKIAVTDSEGKVLALKRNYSKVATVIGLRVQEAKEGSKIKTSNDAALEKMLNVLNLNEQNDLYFKKISMKGNVVNAWIYDDLVCTGKYSNVVSCIEDGILKSVVYDLYQKGTEKGTIKISDDNYCFFTPKN